MKNIIQSLKIITLGLILALGLSYAFAWTAPTSNPPAGNVAAPINVGGSSQVKSGALSSLISFDTPLGYFGKIGIGTASPNAKVTVANGDILLKQNVTTGASGSNTIGLSVDIGAGTGAAASIGILKEAANNAASLIFKNWNGANTVETMRIKSNGDVVVSGTVCDSNGCIGSGGGGGSVDWGDITNKPAGFADNVDDVQVKNLSKIYQCPGPSCSATVKSTSCNNQLTTISSCSTRCGNSRDTWEVPQSCTFKGYLVQ